MKLVLLNKNKTALIQIGLICLVVATTFATTLQNSFVWDDADFILGWPELANLPENISGFMHGQVPALHRGLYRPLRSIFYSISFLLWHTNPQAYHLQAVVIHILGTLLLFLLLKQLTKDPGLPFLSALLFGVHPIHVEAVAWITPSFDIIGVLLAVVSVYLYTIWAKQALRLAFQLSVAAATMAYFTNEITLVLPGLIVWYDVCFNLKKITVNSLTSYSKKWVWFVLPNLGYLLIRFGILKIGARADYLFDSLSQTLLVMVVAVIKQLQLLLVPYPLTVNHTILPGIISLFHQDLNRVHPPTPPTIFTPQVLLAAGLLLILSFLWWRYFRDNKLVTFLAGWHFLAIIPLLQLVPQTIIFGERYLYFASFGSISLLVVLLSYAVKKLFPSQAETTLLLSVLGVSLIFAGMSYQQNKVWRTNQTLWQHTLDVGPRTAYSLNNLAKVYSERGELSTAQALLEEAYQTNPTQPIATTNLGLLYTALGEYDKAIQLHQFIYQIASDYSPNIEKLAIAYLRKGDTAQAIEWYTKYAQLRPHDIQAQLSLAQAYHTAFILNMAEQQYQAVLNLDPDNADAYYGLVEVYLKLGKPAASQQAQTKLEALGYHYQGNETQTTQLPDME